MRPHWPSDWFSSTSNYQGTEELHVRPAACEKYQTYFGIMWLWLGYLYFVVHIINQISKFWKLWIHMVMHYSLVRDNFICYPTKKIICYFHSACTSSCTYQPCLWGYKYCICVIFWTIFWNLQTWSFIVLWYHIILGPENSCSDECKLGNCPDSITYHCYCLCFHQVIRYQSILRTTRCFLSSVSLLRKIMTTREYRRKARMIEIGKHRIEML